MYRRWVLQLWVLQLTTCLPLRLFLSGNACLLGLFVPAFGPTIYIYVTRYYYYITISCTIDYILYSTIAYKILLLHYYYEGLRVHNSALAGTVLGSLLDREFLQHTSYNIIFDRLLRLHRLGKVWDLKPTYYRKQSDAVAFHEVCNTQP
jgi:hypothetical protein